MNRLRELRKKAGLTLQEVAEAAGTTNQMVGMLERGERKLTVEWLERFAPILGVKPPDILAETKRHLVPIVGYVGAGEIMFSLDEDQNLEEIEFPISEQHPNMVGVKVRGDSMLPAYKDGDVLFYNEKRFNDYEGFVGKDCIVRLMDGRTYLKELQRSNGAYWLHSYNAPPILNIKIDWIARVLWILRA